MPIKGFLNIKDQTEEKVVIMYGSHPKHKDKSKFSLVLKDCERIPYFCDKTNEEFTLVWGKLKHNLLYPHFKKNASKNPLTKNDINFIKENYPKYGTKYCSEKLKCSQSTICRNAKKLGLNIIPKLIPNEHKECYSCHNILSFDYFTPKQRTSINQGKCKECSNKYHIIHKNKLKSTSAGRKHQTILRMLAGTKNRAKQENLDFSLDYEWITKNFSEECPILKLKFILCSGKIYPNSPSIDRLIPNKGYIKENCRIISFRANLLKNNASIQEVEAILGYMKENIIN